MAGTKVDAARVEIIGLMDAFAPELEGLQDYARLNLKPDTMEEVQALIALYQRRMYVLQTAKDALEGLISDGHPGMPVRQVSEDELDDLQNNLDTITAARARFVSDPAVSMALSAGATEQK